MSDTKPYIQVWIHDQYGNEQKHDLPDCDAFEVTNSGALMRWEPNGYF